jgi:hypothetical protein
MEIPENFRSVITDFIKDLTPTFPEFANLWQKWSATDSQDFTELFQYCLTVYPERFFDILYQNEDIFKPDSETNTMFLPGVDFKLLYNCQGISETTQKSIWKYLQVILFSVVGSVKDKEGFGDTSSLFEDINKEELHEKLKEAVGSIGDFFSKHVEKNGEGEGEENPLKGAFDFLNGASGSAVPNPEDIHNHLSGLFNGKIGTLAKELAEELGNDLASAFGDDMNNMKSTQDVFAKIMQNPDKLSGLVKSVGDKLNQKMSSGAISKDDIMSEAGELMRQMKDMGGAGNFADMFKNMAKGMGVNIPKNVKVDKNALERMEKQMSARDKMKARAEIRKKKKMEEDLINHMKMQQRLEEHRKAVASNYVISGTEDPNNFVFRLEGSEKQEKSSMRPPVDNVSSDDPPKLSASQKKRLKKKNKKLLEASIAEEVEEELA